MTWKCPQCGEENTEAARLCGLCGEVRPEEKPQEIAVRVMAPAPQVFAHPQQLPQTGQGRDRWGAVDATHLPPEEKRRLAEEVAGDIVGRPPDGKAAPVGCGPLALFICFLPWSLILLPVPGGLRNRKATNWLLGIGCAAILITLLTSAASLPWILNKLQSLGNSYKDAAGG
jgi:hypothetical protein